MIFLCAYSDGFGNDLFVVDMHIKLLLVLNKALLYNTYFKCLMLNVINELVALCELLYIESIVNSLLFGFFCRYQKQCVMILTMGLGFEM